MAIVYSTYTRLSVQVGGILLFQEASVSLKRSANASMVKSVLLGFDGFTTGAPTMTGTITNTVPSVALEFNAGPNIQVMQPVKLVLLRGDPSTQIWSLTTNAWFHDDTINHAVDTNTNYSIDFTAQFADWIAL